MQVAFAPGALPARGVYPNLGWAAPGSTLVVSPTVLTAVWDGDYTIFASEPASYTALHGTFVVSGDSMSAVYTAPSSGTSDTITVCSLDDIGDCVDVPVALFQYLSGGAGSFVIAAGVGTLTDSIRPGAYGGASSSPAPSPVLLPGLIGWSFLSNGNQTLDDTGIITTGLNWSMDGGSLSFSLNGVFFDDDAVSLTQPHAAAMELGDVEWGVSAVVKAVANPVVGGFVYLGKYGDGDDEYQFQTTENYKIEGDIGVTGGAESALLAPALADTNYHQLDFRYDPADNKCYMSVDAGAETAFALSGPMLTVAEGDAFIFLSGSGGTHFYLKWLRMWVGNTFAMSSDGRTARYNSGSFMTDAALAAYTG